MASKRKPTNDAKINASLSNSLFERLKLPGLRTALKAIFPTKRIETKGYNTLVMNCVNPTHDDQTPSMYIYVSKNLAICSACMFRTRSPLELLSVGAGYSTLEALQQLKTLTGVPLVPDKLGKTLEEQDVHQVATRLIGSVCNDFMTSVAAYSIDGMAVPDRDRAFYPPSLLHTVKPVLAWLFDTRKLDRGQAAYMPYGVAPPIDTFKELLSRHLDDFVTTGIQQHSAVTSAYSKERRKAIQDRALELYGTIPAEYSLAVTFHTGFSSTTAGRIRCRRVTQTQGTDNAFWNMPGFSDSDPIGYLGLLNGTAGSRRENVDKLRVIMVESEISALILQQNIINDAIPDVLVVASAGSNNETDLLHSAGFATVDLLMDHPDPVYGKGEDQVRLKLQSALHIQPRVFTAWSALSGDRPAVKDPDDVVQEFGWEHARKYLIDDERQTFTPLATWASDRAIEEAQVISDDNPLVRQNTVAEYGRCVRHPTLLAQFVHRVSEALGLPQGPLRAAIVQLKDDESGLIARIVETIKAEFSILYKDDSARVPAVVLYHKQHRRYVSVPINEGASIMTALSNVFGEMYTYFNDNIGLPFTEDDMPNLTSPMSIRDGQKFVADYLRIAFQEIYRGVLALEECTLLGPGIHYFPGEAGESKALLRIHNGNRWFKVRVDAVDETISPEELIGPIDDEFVFDSKDERWSDNLLSAHDLIAANSITVEDLRVAFERVLHVVNHGWRFRHQRADSLFFTAALFAFATGDAFDIKLILRIIGESNSGKSTLLSLLCKGQAPGLSLNDNAGYMTSYTNASLYQSFDRSRLTMVLEEASQDPNVATHKSMQMDDINETLRQIIYEGGISVTRGTHSGRPKTYTLHTNVAMTTITEPRDVQEANRSYMIETAREEGRMDPAIALGRDMSPQEFAATKRTIQLGLLRFFPRLRAKQQEIYQYLNTNSVATYPAHSRFLRNFAPIGAILDLVGRNWLEDVKEMIEAKRERQLGQAANSASRSLVDRLMRAAVIPIAGSRASLTTPMQCLSSPGGYELVNNANVGIVIDPNNWLVIFDHVALMAPGGAGCRIQEIMRQTPHQVKATVDQHPDIVPSRRYKELAIPSILAQIHSSAVDHEISVIDMSRVRKAVEIAAKEYGGKALVGAGSGPGGVSDGGSGDVF